MVSRLDHRLVELLSRWQIGELPIDVEAVVANHDDRRAIAARQGVPLDHIAVKPVTEPACRGTHARPHGRARCRRRRPTTPHAAAVHRGVRAATRPGHQHPPLVPARRSGRRALPAGVRPRGDTQRRHRPLRHRRPRRGPDHRAGRSAGAPRRRPGAGERRPDRCVLLGRLGVPARRRAPATNQREVGTDSARPPLVVCHVGGRESTAHRRRSPEASTSRRFRRDVGVEVIGFEPTASSLRTKRSARLSYTPRNRTATGPRSERGW